jgi:GntR family transcriptional regulator, transcriptional repressor for pyruvate dehydrogenase complex
MTMSSASASMLARAAVLRGGVEPLVADRLSDRLARRLMQQIEGGALKPGDRLPTEAQLAATHGVSRSVVREAVHQVKSRGLLRSRQGSGVYVELPSPHQALAFDASVLESLEAVVQVVELRRVLEGEMAALAAQRITRTQLVGLRRALAAIDSASESGADAVAEDLSFHRAIGEATGNPQFSRMLAFLEQYLREAMRVTRGNEARSADWMQQVRGEHRAIYDAIAAGDAAAARRAAVAHLQHAEVRLHEGGLVGARRRPRVPTASPRVRRK